MGCTGQGLDLGLNRGCIGVRGYIGLRKGLGFLWYLKYQGQSHGKHLTTWSMIREARGEVERRALNME